MRRVPLYEVPSHAAGSFGLVRGDLDHQLPDTMKTVSPQFAVRHSPLLYQA